MGDKDKKMLVLAFIALLFIGFITVKNYPNPGKTLNGATYYTSDETTTLGKREGSSYDALNSIGRVECPGLGNTSSKGTLVSTSGVTTSANAYGVCYLPYTMECSGVGVTALNKSNFTSIMKKPDSKTIEGMFKSPEFAIDGTYTEIVAPFSYSFNSYNLDNSENGDKIIITNSVGNCRMTITGYANWFCAGLVGTETNYSNIEEPAPWTEHNNHHMSRVGYGSQNYSKGSPGDLIAYGNKDTTIEFHAIVNGSWQEVSLYDLCRTARIK